MDIKKDLFKYQKLLWKGFDHEGPVPVDEITIDKKKRMLSARNMNSFLHIVAENEERNMLLIVAYGIVRKLIIFMLNLYVQFRSIGRRDLEKQ
ncbi:hypothetical protein [Paenibacillus xylanivorans]|uniref:Uncharacterized protein n=1 Tax=Paenibacillus xylanivorans TaxID=1705561 RepID=A0A0M9BST1_9BACL|nr:hypothetical protein [Paenibacillus xylanivorans]KOY17422.1 hypothetical protein AMS66_06490 [Paenibacillus xylanivorans]